jgi:hypothetical protein
VQIFVQKREYLKELVDKKKIFPRKETIELISAWKDQNLKKELQRFIGLVNYAPKFVINMSLSKKPSQDFIKD